MKTILFALVMVFCIPAFGFSAQAQWEGSIQGLTCALHGKVCPAGMEDPFVEIEDTFVLVTDDGWFLLPNLAEEVLMRHLNDRVRVIGTQDENPQVIRVDELQEKDAGEWETVWSAEMREEAETLQRGWGGF